MIHQDVYPLVVVGHGTRDPEGVLEFQTLLTQIVAVHGGIVESGFLEIQTPRINEAIDCAVARSKGHTSQKVVVLPAQLLGARHVQVDIANAIDAARRRHPDILIYFGKSLEQHDKIIELCRVRCETVLSASPVMNRLDIALLVVGRGMSDPHNNIVPNVAQTLQKKLGCGLGIGCYAGMATPLLAEAFNRALQKSIRAFLILPFFLFMGKLVRTVQEDIEQWQKKHPECEIRVAEHLGPDPFLRDALIERYLETLHFSASRTISEGQRKKKSRGRLQRSLPNA